MIFRQFYNTSHPELQHWFVKADRHGMAIDKENEVIYGNIDNKRYTSNFRLELIND